MTTDKRRAANRENARRSTGPRSEAGKAAARTNATRHGLLSTLRVLRPLETEEEWVQHLEATRAAVRPTNYIETLLTERLALGFWRLRRLARHEQAVGEVRIDGTRSVMSRETSTRSVPLYEAERQAQAAVEKAKHDANTVVEARRGQPDDYVDPEIAARVVRAVACLGGVNADCDELRELFGEDRHPAHALEQMPWTCERLLHALADLEDATGIETNEAFDELVKVNEAALARVAAEIDRLSRARSVPPADQLEKLARYETTIERSIGRAVEAIERIRVGQPFAAETDTEA